MLAAIIGCLATASHDTTVYKTVQASSPDLYFPRAGGDPAPALEGLYNAATSRLDIAVYSLTHPDIVAAIRAAKARGIAVRVISDRLQSSGETQKHAINILLLNNIPVKINSHSGLMHLKMSLIDNSIVTLGSYNYSMNASERNDEVMIVIRDPDKITACQAEFDRMWSSEKFTDARSSY